MKYIHLFRSVEGSWRFHEMGDSRVGKPHKPKARTHSRISKGFWNGNGMGMGVAV